jgi:hypothetical protein
MLDQQYLLEQEKKILDSEMPELENYISTRKTAIENELIQKIDRLKQQLQNLPANAESNIQGISNFIKKIFLELNIRFREQSFNLIVSISIRRSSNLFAKKKNRYQYLDTQFTDAVNKNCLVPLRDHDRKKGIIDEVNSFIYGALGEQKVVNELAKLSDEYFLINDFNVTFRKAIYYRQENAYIKSIQVDHLLISPSGVFIIETKNWSEDSINNLSLRSPVDQIRRSSFVLFKILSDKSSNTIFSFNTHHWGARKIPIRNLIVLINRKPKEEFQYVKVLTLNELTGYVKYFKPIFSNEETEEIAKYLIDYTNY